MEPDVQTKCGGGGFSKLLPGAGGGKAGSP
jgi:hypothetical protein